MNFPVMNLHNHTKDFSDGAFSIPEIVDECEKAGFAAVGITDHFDTSKVPRSVNHDNFIEYVAAVRKAGENRKLKVLAGLELDSAELYRRIPDFIKGGPFSKKCPSEEVIVELLGELPGMQMRLLDYVIFEYVNNVGCLSLETVLRLAGKLPVPVILGHPSIKRDFSDGERSSLPELLAKNGIIIEINCGSRNRKDAVPYYRETPDFYELMAASGVKFVIGTDTHDKREDITDIKDAVDFINEWRLESAICIPGGVK